MDMVWFDFSFTSRSDSSRFYLFTNLQKYSPLFLYVLFALWLSLSFHSMFSPHSFAFIFCCVLCAVLTFFSIIYFVFCRKAETGNEPGNSCIWIELWSKTMNTKRKKDANKQRSEKKTKTYSTDKIAQHFEYFCERASLLHILRAVFVLLSFFVNRFIVCTTKSDANKWNSSWKYIKTN